MTKAWANALDLPGLADDVHRRQDGLSRPSLARVRTKIAWGSSIRYAWFSCGCTIQDTRLAPDASVHVCFCRCGRLPVVGANPREGAGRGCIATLSWRRDKEAYPKPGCKSIRRFPGQTLTKVPDTPHQYEAAASPADRKEVPKPNLSRRRSRCGSSVCQD